MLRTVLLVLVVGLFLWWWLRRPSAATKQASRPARESSPPSPEAMVQCAECGVHLPASQALPGRGGHFCGAAHRQVYEQRHPE